MAAYPISVVVPSMRGWPEMRLSIDSVLPQLREVGGQLVVADGSGRPPPSEIADAPHVEWLSLPGSSVFDLRQGGYRRADGAVIAVTEDHCRPAADWVASVLLAHSDDPDAALIFGSVDNGTRDHLVDWALYSAGYGQWAPPLSASVGANPGHANISWKRWVFERFPVDGERVLEFRFSAALREAGERVVGDPRMRVEHFQCASVATNATLFFHNGRAIGGTRRTSMGGPDWARLWAPGLIAAYRTLRTLRGVWRKPAVRGPALKGAPLIMLLHLAHAFGESVGYATGPGDSASHLH